MHSSRMHTTHLLTVSHSIPGGGGLPKPHWRQTPLDTDPMDADLPGGGPPGMQSTLEADRQPSRQTPSTWMQTPPGHVTCDACWEANPL